MSHDARAPTATKPSMAPPPAPLYRGAETQASSSATPPARIHQNGSANGNGFLMPPPHLPAVSMEVGSSNGNNYPLRLVPDANHEPESYEDLELEFSPLLFSSLERYLPPQLINSSRDTKVQVIRDILLRYSTDGDRTRVLKHREYRHKIMSNYKPLHKDLYSINADYFFVPSFLRAIKENTEESFRSIISEPSPGVLVFEMLQPLFCAMLLAEIEHFEKWVHDTKFRIMRPNTMNRYGAVLDDFGMENMLDKLMEEFIRPMSRVFFREVGGSSLDSHHGFVVEYGMDRDNDLGFHVDDSEVTLNVCLGKQFTGGELFFRGVRCEKHVNTETQPEEIYDFSHVPGRAVLHRGRHRHGARATTSGHRINLLLWCRSSAFREMKKYQKEFSAWCAECHREKKERQRRTFSATKMELIRRSGRETAV